MPSTNNALESFNKNIKENVTNYQKMDFGDFMNKIWEYVHELSRKTKELPFPKCFYRRMHQKCRPISI